MGTAANDAAARPGGPPRPQTHASGDRPPTDPYYPTHPNDAFTAFARFYLRIYRTTIGDSDLSPPSPPPCPLLLSSLPQGALHAASTYCAPGDWAFCVDSLEGGREGCIWYPGGGEKEGI